MYPSHTRKKAVIVDEVITDPTALPPVASHFSSNQTSMHTSPRSPQRCASKPSLDRTTSEVEVEVKRKWTRARTPRWCTASSSRVKLQATFPKTQLVGRRGGIDVIPEWLWVNIRQMVHARCWAGGGRHLSSRRSMKNGAYVLSVVIQWHLTIFAVPAQLVPQPLGSQETRMTFKEW